MTKLVYLNERFMPEGKAFLSMQDLSVERGYAMFDFFRLVGNEPLHLEDHLNRFYSSAIQMRLTVPKTREELKLIINELIWKNEMPGSGIRMQLTGGKLSADGTLRDQILMVSQNEFSTPAAEHQRHGIGMVSFAHQRQLAQVKTTDYIMSIWLQPLLQQQEASEILYHSNGIITESPRSNFFIVTHDNKLITPRHHILKGITRMKILMLAAQHYTTEERDVTLDEAYGAKEAFITSTTKQILPVTQLDKKKINSGIPGEATKHLSELLRAYCGL